jgi:hypothetical protein
MTNQRETTNKEFNSKIRRRKAPLLRGIVAVPSVQPAARVTSRQIDHIQPNQPAGKCLVGRTIHLLERLHPISKHRQPLLLQRLHLLCSSNDPAPASPPLHSKHQVPASSCRKAHASASCWQIELASSPSSKHLARASYQKASAKHASSQQAPTNTCSMRRMMTAKL